MLDFNHFKLKDSGTELLEYTYWSVIDTLNILIKRLKSGKSLSRDERGEQLQIKYHSVQRFNGKRFLKNLILLFYILV